MLKLIKPFFIAVLIWEIMIALSIVAIYAIARKTSPSGEDKPWLIWSFLLGLVVALCCVPLCNKLRRSASTILGLSLGLMIPLLVGWFWGPVMEPWVFSWRHPFIGLDAWIAGLHLSVPSAAAGAIIGYTQSRTDLPDRNTANV